MNKMANPYSGEVSLVIDGREHVLKLTLGALAELEASMKAGSLVDMVQRFETGAYSSSDVLALILAGLRGGGSALDAQALLTADIEGGPMAAARVAAKLLARAFMVPGEA